MKKFTFFKLGKIDDPLYKNSFYLMCSSIGNSGFGFLFWIIAARLYPKEEVGIATALISSMSLIILITRFGLDDSIIRFSPNYKLGNILSTSIIITTIASLVTGIIFIIGIPLWSPNLSIIYSQIIFYLAFLIIYSINTLTAVSLITLRKSGLYLLQTIILGSRVIILLPLIFLGAFGIYNSLGLAYLVALIYSFYIFRILKVDIPWILDRSYFIQSLKFSLGTYVSVLLLTAPSMLLPIFVLNLVGPSASAIYYLAFSIVSILFVIPNSFSTSLFVEGSYGVNLKTANTKSIIASYIILIPCILIFYFFGDSILGMVGKGYTEGAMLIKILALSSIFVTFSNQYLILRKVQKEMKTLIILSCSIFIFLMGFSYIFISKFGLIGIGYSWVLTYGIICIMIGIIEFFKSY